MSLKTLRFRSSFNKGKGKNFAREFLGFGGMVGCADCC